MLKDQVKILAWGGFCIKEKTSLYYFSEIIDAEFYVNILCSKLSEIEDLLEND